MFLYCSPPCIIYIQHTSIWSAFHKAHVTQGFPGGGGGMGGPSQDAGNYTFENFVILGHSAIVMTLPTFWPLSMSICNFDNLQYSFKECWMASLCLHVWSHLQKLSFQSLRFFFPMEMKMLISSSLEYGKDFMTHCLLLAHTAAHTEPQIYMEVTL